MRRRPIAVIVLGAAALVALAAPAWAHVDLDPPGELAWISAAEGESEVERPAPRLTLVADPSATTTARPASTPEPPTTTPDADLPGTTLEAQERDDGNTSAAPWVIGSGIAALAAIGIGGTVLKRRMG